jgi:hypothetical protein
LAGGVWVKIIKIMPMAMLALLLLVILGVVTNIGLVTADSCTAQLNYPVTPTMYYGSNVQIVVPVSATCSFTGGQLYAVGNAYDTSLNANLGSANTALVPINAGNVYSGQLVFNLPSIAQGHTVQISVSIYNGGLNGPILTTTAQTVQVPSNYYYNYPANYCYPGYNCYPWYPSYPSYPSYYWYPSPPHHHHREHPFPPSPPPEPPHHHWHH